MFWQQRQQITLSILVNYLCTYVAAAGNELYIGELHNTKQYVNVSVGCVSRSDFAVLTRDNRLLMVNPLNPSKKKLWQPKRRTTRMRQPRRRKSSSPSECERPPGKNTESATH